MKFLFNLFAVLVVFMVLGTTVAMAQDATETDEAPIVDVVAPVEDGAVAPVVLVEDNNGSPAWYLLALAVVVFFATFTQYNFERMTGKSMRELSNSVPSHAVTLLLNGGSYLARLTTTDADDKALLKVGEGMGYVPMKLTDGSVLWTAPTTIPMAEAQSFDDNASYKLSPEELERAIDPIVKKRMTQLIAKMSQEKAEAEQLATAG